MPGIGDRLEGIHAVTAALRAGRVVSMTVERGPAKSGEMRQLIALAEEVGAAVKLVADVSPLAATSAPQGVVATARPLPTVSLVDLVERAARPALIVLDHAEDPRNVGAIARSARAAGFDGMVVAERRAAPLGATAFKAAVGAFESLPVAVVNSIADSWFATLMTLVCSTGATISTSKGTTNTAWTVDDEISLVSRLERALRALPGVRDVVFDLDQLVKVGWKWKSR